MGYWTHARVGGGQWMRVWITDEEEERQRKAAEELVYLLNNRGVVHDPLNQDYQHK